MDDFEWDPEKAEANLRRHGVSFEEAAKVFADPLARIDEDLLHSQGEVRQRIIGRVPNGQVLVVIFTERPRRICLLSARPAEPTERREHERFPDPAARHRRRRRPAGGRRP